MLEQLTSTAILGLIQGFTEWLPVSSTGHLRVAEHFLGLTTTPLFNVLLHLGTLAVVIIYFRKDVKNILLSLLHLDFGSEEGRLIPLIVVGMLPTALIAFIYVIFLEDVLQQILPVAIALVCGATMVYVSRLGKDSVSNITYPMALIMGIMQGLAVFPGLSRSGVTISTGLLLGLKRERAFRFSFLLSIPTVIGAVIVESCKQSGRIAASGLGWAELTAGVAVAVIVGFVSLGLLSRIIATKRFHYFAFYTWALGVSLIALSIGSF